MSVNDLLQGKERPSYVRFERVAVEDVQASIREGRYVGRDVDMANITPPGSKDIFKQRVKDWFVQLEMDQKALRIPPEWVEHYKKQYAAWKNGQEVPLNGTPILGWGVISPAQQQSIIAANVLTVEDFANLNAEGVARIGMGAVSLQSKARAWVAQTHDKGPLTQKMAAVETENALLRSSVETLQRQVEELMKQNVPHGTPNIAASDIIETNFNEHDDLVAQYTQKFGQPPHHRMKDSTIAAKLQE